MEWILFIVLTSSNVSRSIDSNYIVFPTEESCIVAGNNIVKMRKSETVEINAICIPRPKK